jgi:hypothetical protein
MLLKRRPVAALIAALLGIFLGSALARAERSELFTVSAVPVDATAANALAARDAARRDGARRAFDMLMQRIVAPADLGKVPHPSDAMLDGLVQGFEVAHEKTSGVRYIAELTFSFRRDAVRRLLRQAGVSFAETASKPLLVLPVLRLADRAVLWEDNNPWRDAWGAHPLPVGLVPLVLPLGELEDVAAIDGAAAAAGDDARLAAISQRYGNADVLVTRATLTAGDAASTLTIDSTRYAPGVAGARETFNAVLTASPGESDADLMARGVADTIAKVEESWRNANLVNLNQTGTLVAAVPVSDLRSWVAVRQQIGAVAIIQRTELLSLDKHGARVTLHFVGDPQQLKLALAQHNLDLGGADPEWVLTPRTGSH